MESLGIISKVDESIPWCARMAVVPKKNGRVHISVHLKCLNESILWVVHPQPRVNEILAQLTGATVFSKLQLLADPLAKSSQFFTTFITPLGRYYFNKLLFGIAGVPEHFQKWMAAIPSGLNGVVCQMDDVLVVGSNQRQPDDRLTAALKCIESRQV